MKKLEVDRGFILIFERLYWDKGPSCYRSHAYLEPERKRILKENRKTLLHFLRQGAMTNSEIALALVYIKENLRGIAEYMARIQRKGWERKVEMQSIGEALFKAFICGARDNSYNASGSESDFYIQVQQAHILAQEMVWLLEGAGLIKPPAENAPAVNKEKEE